MKRFVFLAVAIVSFSCGTARGDIIYDLYFRAAGLADGINTTETVASGQSFTGVELILRETVSGGSASLFADDTLLPAAGSFNRAGNINSYNANVFATGSNGSFSNLSLNNLGGAANPQNDNNTLGYFAIATALGTPGRMATEVTPSVREIVMGTANLTAPTTGSTTFSVQDFDPLTEGDFTIFGSGAGSLEGAATASGGSFNGHTLTLSAVPEPSSLMVIGLCAGLGLVRRRSRSV